MKTEWKNGWKPTGTNGVLVRESVVGGETIATFYARGRRDSKPFFEKIGVDGRIYPEYAGYREKKVRGVDQGTLDEALAGCVRSAIIRGEVELASKRRKKEQEAKEGALTFNALWKRMLSHPDRGHKVNADGSIDFTTGWRGSKKADEKYQKHIAPRFGNREPKDIRVHDVDSFRAELAEVKNYSKATTVSLIGLLKSIANYGADLEICPGLAFKPKLKGKNLGKNVRVKKAPTQEERERFIATCKSWPDRQEADFMLLIVHTGIRRGSAQNLKWVDINFDRKTATLVDSKTGTIEISIDDDAIALLKNHPREMISDYVFTGRGWEPLLTKTGEPVLHRKNGKMRPMQIERDLPMLTQRQVDRVPAKIRDAAGLSRDLDPCHCFRRFHANRLHNSGLNPKAGAKGGGWKSVNMYLHYLTAEDEEIKKALNATVTKVPVQA